MAAFAIARCLALAKTSASPAHAAFAVGLALLLMPSGLLLRLLARATWGYFEQLVTADKVDLLMGPYATGAILSAMGVAQRYGKVLVHHTFGIPSLAKYDGAFPAWSLGADPQDKKYQGEPTQLVIGDRNTIREFTTDRKSVV